MFKKNLSLIIGVVVLMSVFSTAHAVDKSAKLLDKATYSLVATFRVKEDKIEEFREAMKYNVIESRKEPGVVVYRTYQLETDPTVFVNYETYVNKAAFDAHLETPHVKTIGPKLEKEMLSGPIEVEFLLDY